MAKSSVKKSPAKSKEKKAFVLIRATGDDTKLIEDLKKLTGSKTNAGALMRAGKDYIEQQKTISNLQKDNAAQEKHIQELATVVKFAFNGVQMLMNYGTKKFPKDKYPQMDMFDQE